MNTCQNTATQRPRYHTSADENGATLQVALPGARKEDVKLTLLQSTLKIETGGDARRYGLQLRLAPRLDGSRATATFEAGVLALQIPVREEAKPREIAVN